MNRSIGKKLVAVLASAVVLGALASAPAAEHPAQGPAYPPPGGVDWSANEGSIGRSGGVAWSYEGFDMPRFLDLWWGPWGAEGVQLALDGEIDGPGETLTFDLGSSDLEAGMARWMGAAEIELTTGTTSLPTRFTLTADAPLHAEGAAGIEGPGALVPVAGPYTINLLLEALHGGSWQPVLDLYDSLNTVQGAEDVRISVGGGFYYHLNQAPEAAISSDPAQPVAEEEATLSANASDADGTVALIEWDLDADGEYDDASGETVSHTFPAKGLYEVAVRVTDDRGLSATASASIEVVRCDEGAISGTVHEVGEPVADAVGEGRTLHDANCELLAANGL